MRAQPMPHPGQHARPIGVPMPALMIVIMKALVLMTRAVAAQVPLRIAHARQHARMPALQHTDNNHPEADARHPQQGM